MTLISYYPMDGSATDIVGGNNGSVSGATSTSSGFLGTQAYSFDGTDDEIVVGTPTDLDFTASDSFSITQWLKPTNATPSASNTVGNRNSAAFNFVIQRFEGDGTFLQTIKGDSNSNSVSFTVTGGQWVHIVVTYDSNSSEVVGYKSGVEQGRDSSSSLSGSLSGDSWDFGHGPTGYYNGIMDSVRFYNRVLTPTEVRYLSEAPKQGTFTTQSKLL